MSACVDKTNKQKHKEPPRLRSERLGLGAAETDCEGCRSAKQIHLKSCLLTLEFQMTQESVDRQRRTEEMTPRHFHMINVKVS